MATAIMSLDRRDGANETCVALVLLDQRDPAEPAFNVCFPQACGRSSASIAGIEQSTQRPLIAASR